MLLQANHAGVEAVAQVKRKVLLCHILGYLGCALFDLLPACSHLRKLFVGLVHVDLEEDKHGQTRTALRKLLLLRQ